MISTYTKDIFHGEQMTRIRQILKKNKLKFPDFLIVGSQKAFSFFPTFISSM
jgi:hypothetical protein